MKIHSGPVNYINEPEIFYLQICDMSLKLVITIFLKHVSEFL